MSSSNFSLTDASRSPHLQTQKSPRLDKHQQQRDSKVTQKANSSKPQSKSGKPFVSNMQSIFQMGKAWLTPMSSNSSLNKNGFTTVKDANALFPSVDPNVDGEECLQDCSSCTVSLPRKWSVDESHSLFGHVGGWETHLIVATGKTDWVRDVTDEKGSLMEKIGQVSKGGEYNGRKIMLSASDLPTGNDHGDNEVDSKVGYPKGTRTRCLILPSWKMVESISTDQVEWMMDEVVSKSSSNVQMIKKEKVHHVTGILTPDSDGEDMPVTLPTTLNMSPPRPALSTAPPPPEGVSLTSCPHRAIILMCSHKTRDWRCGASAPLLRKEFERHLRPLGMYRDVHDERPGGVGIYFINHVGGHKYSANVMIYRREGRSKDNSALTVGHDMLHDEAVQGIWLARVRPEDCENIVKYTVLQGKLVKSQRQLRGGFDRESGLISW